MLLNRWPNFLIEDIRGKGNSLYKLPPRLAALDWMKHRWKLDVVHSRLIACSQHNNTKAIRIAAIDVRKEDLFEALQDHLTPSKYIANANRRNHWILI